MWGTLHTCEGALTKHSLGHSEAGAQKHSKSTSWGTFRPGPLSTPVNGGRDRKSLAIPMKHTEVLRSS